MLCTSLCTIINSFIMQRGVTLGGGCGVLCYRTLQLLCTSLCTIINRRGAAGGAGCCDTHTTVYFLLSAINERGADCAVGGLVRDGAVCTTYITVYYH